MPRKKVEIPADEKMEVGDKSSDEGRKSLAWVLSSKPLFKSFSMWLVGDTPLIVHAWSEKARRQMLEKQVRATKPGKEPRDPQADFVSSLYEMGDGGYGFPATGIKNCIMSSAHRDKGIAKTTVMAGLWLDAEMVRVRPALAGAICDMPMIRIHGGAPEMREDMVKVGVGLNKVASLAYRGQFTVWAMKVNGRYNSSALTDQALAFLVQEAGMAYGLGEWRNERKGLFGAFHLASVAEEAHWEAYAADTGPLPLPEGYRMAAE